MKNILLIFTLASFLFLVSCGSNASEGNVSSQEAIQKNTSSDNIADTVHESVFSEIIDIMHAPMMKQPFQKTSNIDIDFLFNMIPHHQGAILSSKRLLETSKNADVTDLANNIIKAQEFEVTEFTALIKELETKNTDYSAIDTAKIGDDMENIMNKMMTDMSSIQVTGDNDIDFLQGMIPHHQGAVDAAEKILESTKDEKIKEIANRIIIDQEKEINYMNELINNLSANN
ncbi:DUF305 domain-containing protein [Brachyspira sp.]|uniref:DUF305 domain-containing protein n=1 Tax=Brachyspira sp. TaxID=1977261 RepID=UPI00261450F7|nr:DUF305 domain-containing protein [Brachyspira sp.]